MKDTQVEVTSILPKVARILAKPLINKLGRIPLSSHPGDVFEQSGGTYYVIHPSVDFNSGSINTTVIKEVLAYGQDILRPSMQRNQILAGRVGIEIFNNGVQVADRSLRSRQSFDYKVPGGYNTEYDGYEVHYAVSVELIFNVVKTANIDGTTFVDLDYNLQDIKSDKFPSIDSFLKK